MFIDLTRWAVGAIVLLFGLYVASMNWACIISSLRNQRIGINKHYSTVPIFGAAAMIVGLLILPCEKAGWMWYIALLDISTIWVIPSVPFLIREVWDAKPKK
jgi:hypothetical protein